MDFGWAIDGITDEVPRTTGPECINYMTNRRRWIEAILFTIIFIFIIRWAKQRLDPIALPSMQELQTPHSAIRLILLITMTFIFGIEIGFKFAGKSVIFVLNPCHIQTLVQIYLLAAKPSKVTTALFRIQMNNLNGPVLAFLFPEVEFRTLPFEQATYWIQHALLYIIPIYILRSGAYKIEEISDYNWVAIGVMVMLLYHFVILNAISIYTGINLNHMLCAAVADPFQGQNYRIAAVIHESILCPILNKTTVLIFRNKNHNNNNNNKQKTNINNYSTEILDANQMPFDASTETTKITTMLHKNGAPSSTATTSKSFLMYRDPCELLYHQQEEQQQQQQQHQQQQFLELEEEQQQQQRQLHQQEQRMQLQKQSSLEAEVVLRHRHGIIEADFYDNPNYQMESNGGDGVHPPPPTTATTMMPTTKID